MSQKRTRRRPSAFACRELTIERWPDLEMLFGVRGACGGCWCMWWRLSHSQWTANKGDRNKSAFKRVVKAGPPPGLIGYAEGQPVAWIALGPREDYPRFERSRVLKALDDQRVWSITCFFVLKSHRRRGYSVRMLKEAVDFARSCGARIVEGYPIDPRQKESPDAFVWTGLSSTFVRAGFTEVARRSPTRPIMRRKLGRLRRASSS